MKVKILKGDGLKGKVVEAEPYNDPDFGPMYAFSVDWPEGRIDYQWPKDWCRPVDNKA